MMPVAYNGNLDFARLPIVGNGHDGLLDELTRQLATVHHQNRHASRAYSTQHQGGAMRVVKPRSAHNSPISNFQKRRTVVNNNQSYTSPTRPVDENLYLPSQIYGHNMDPTPSARPFSWHAPSQFAPQPGAQVLGQQLPQYHAPVPQYAEPSYAEADYFVTSRHLPPTPAVFSGYTSPASAFSPLSLPTTGLEPQPAQYFPQASWAALPELSPPAPRPEPDISRATRTSAESNAQPEKLSTTTIDSWNSFVTHGFGRCTAPPTPEDFIQAPQAEPRLQSEDSIPYQPLEGDEEEDGEILYGMGLYDTPEKPVDAQLQYHRSAISSLLGSTFASPEQTGKGLKLEDAWEPPVSEDGDSQQADDDDDAEADGQSD